MNLGELSPAGENGPRRTRRLISTGVLVGAMVSLLAVGVTGSVAGAQPSTISVTVEASADSATCAPPGSSLRYGTVDTSTSFTLVVMADRQLCAPVTAVAAVYAMPGNGVAWPQTLVERREIVIGAAGTYRITFDKTCQPAQFDVLTGDTPETVSPWGQWHGPLLFPFDLATSFQHWGPGCTRTTTSTIPPSTLPATDPPGTAAPITATPNTAPTTAAPTTAEPTVEASTVEASTTTPGGTEPPAPSDDDPEVLGISASNSPGSPPAVGAAQNQAGPSAAAASLAFTGASSVVLAFSGFVLLTTGVAMLLYPRLLYPRLRTRRYWAHL